MKRNLFSVSILIIFKKFEIWLNVLGSNLAELNSSDFTFITDNRRTADVSEHRSIRVKDFQIRNDSVAYWKDNITINSYFLGTAFIQLQQYNSISNTTTILIDHNNYNNGNSDNDFGHNNNSKTSILKIVVIRKQRIIDHIFTGSVAVLVSLLYIIFGAALDLKILKNLLQKPIVSYSLFKFILTLCKFLFNLFD